MDAHNLSMPTLSLSDGALDTRANHMKPQLAVSYPDKMYRHRFGGDCQVMMTEGGMESDENVVHKDLAVKIDSTSAIWTCFGFRSGGVLQTQVLCKTCPSCCDSTNLHHHLQYNHKDLYKQFKR